MLYTNYIKMKGILLNNFGFLESQIPESLFTSLKKECIFAEKNNKKFISHIQGPYQPLHYQVMENYTILKKYILNLTSLYNKIFPEIHNVKLFTNDLPLTTSPFWINYQKKYEFLPNHNHDGVLSFVIWVNIPYENKNESNNNKYSKAGCFEFTYLNIFGKFFNHSIKLSKKDSGKIIMFPSLLQHCVYPFFTSNEVRISISGNVIFNSEK
jgi:hypothetical protein